MKLGSHVSIRNGYLGAAKEAHRIGAQAFQYFPKNPRILTVKSYDAKDAAGCRSFCREHGILSIAHSPYPTNLSVEEDGLREITVRSILNDLEIAEACGSMGIVVHFGKYKGKEPLQGYKNMIYLLNVVLAQWMGKALLLIENNAGQGVKMGTTLEELVQVRRLTDHPGKIGFCLDTCHAFASGLWTGDNWEEIKKKGMELDFFKYLKAIHLNDSVFPSGSFRDRHANVGKGMIGEQAIKGLLSSSFLQELPVILETPSSPSCSHQDEIRYLQALTR